MRKTIGDLKLSELVGSPYKIIRAFCKKFANYDISEITS